MHRGTPNRPGVGFLALRTPRIRTHARSARGFHARRSAHPEQQQFFPRASAGAFTSLALLSSPCCLRGGTPQRRRSSASLSRSGCYSRCPREKHLRYKEGRNIHHTVPLIFFSDTRLRKHMLRSNTCCSDTPVAHQHMLRRHMLRRHLSP